MSIPQAADDHRLFRKQRGQLLDEAGGEIVAVGSGVAGADDRDDPTAVEIAVAKHVEHQGSVVALQKPLRIVRIAEIERTDGVGLHESGFMPGFGESFVSDFGAEKAVGKAHDG